MNGFLLTLLILLNASAFCADTALNKELIKNPTYKNLQDQVLNDPTLSEAGDSIQSALQRQQEMDATPDGRAKLFYQYKTDDSPCLHCPGYLKLVSEVNSIVEKLKTKDSVSVENERIIQLSRLKFLYYTAKIVLENNEVHCHKVSYLDPLTETELKNGSVKLVAEEALALSNVTDVQFYTGNEVHYFYQGEGEENENIVEVVINKDKTALLRYYKYEPKNKLPTLGGENLADSPEYESVVKLEPKIETEKLLFPTDIKFATIQNKHRLSDSLLINHESKIDFNQQKTNVKLEDLEGNQYLILEGVNNSGGVKTGSALVKYKYAINNNSGVSFQSEIKGSVETVDSPDGGLKNNQSLGLKLTDHNNEYISVKAFLDDAGVDNYSVANSIKAGNGIVTNEVIINRNGEQSYEAGLSNQGSVDLFTLKYSRSSNGLKKYSANVSYIIEPKTKLKTSFSTSADEGESILVSFERNINETTSMVLTLSHSDQEKTNLIYQVDGKF